MADAIKGKVGLKVLLWGISNRFTVHNIFCKWKLLCTQLLSIPLSLGLLCSQLTWVFGILPSLKTKTLTTPVVAWIFLNIRTSIIKYYSWHRNVRRPRKEGNNTAAITLRNWHLKNPWQILKWSIPDTEYQKLNLKHLWVLFAWSVHTSLVSLHSL